MEFCESNRKSILVLIIQNERKGKHRKNQVKADDTFPTPVFLKCKQSRFRNENLVYLMQLKGSLENT